MGIYKYIRETWKKPKQNLKTLWKERLILWRREPATLRIEYPTRLDRARSLGYKAKKGIIVVRQRVLRGGHMRPKITGGRRPKHNRRVMVLTKNYQVIAEERAAKKFPNLEVLNSYEVAKDGKYYWYEIIMIDPAEPSIIADKDKNWIVANQHTRRVYRGLTSAARTYRGLKRKGKGAEKVRPSTRAHDRKLH
ncbi:MAG: 50S ribosomal protein L15e [Candidatus Woesearchaeota archaeon]